MPKVSKRWSPNWNQLWKLQCRLIRSNAFKKLGFSYTRIRISLKWRQVGVDRQSKESALKSLWQMFKADSIDLYFADESTFSMTPVLPSAWQETGKQIEIFPQRDKKVKLFGIFRPDNVAITYQSEENINAGFLVQSINDFCRYLEKPTVLVVDNAPTHRSRVFFEQFSGKTKACISFSCPSIHRI